MDWTAISDLIAEHWGEIFGGVSIPIVVLFLCKFLVGFVLTKIEAKAKLKANIGLAEKLDTTMKELKELDTKYDAVFREYLKDTEKVCIEGFTKALNDYQEKKVEAYNKIMENADAEIKEIEAEQIAFETKLEEVKQEIVEELKETSGNIENNTPKIEETQKVEEDIKEEENIEINENIIEVEVVRE